MRKMVAVRTSAVIASPARTSAKGRSRRSGHARARGSALMPALLIVLPRSCAPVLLGPCVRAPQSYRRRRWGGLQSDPQGGAGAVVTPPPRCTVSAVSYTHLRAHETPEHLVCRLL